MMEDTQFDFGVKMSELMLHKKDTYPDFNSLISKPQNNKTSKNERKNMIKINDTVKIIGTTLCGDDKEKECIKKGTICTVVNIDNSCEDENTQYILVRPIDSHDEPFWYLSKDVEKGHMEWIKDE